MTEECATDPPRSDRRDGARTPVFMTTVEARVLRHDPGYGLTTLYFADGELRVPLIDVAVDAGVRLTIDARDVSIALSRPMDVSIMNRLPGTVAALDRLALPFVRVTMDLGARRLDALVTLESVERLGLEPGVRAWAMIKAVAIGKAPAGVADPPEPRPRLAPRIPDPGPP